MESVCNGGNSKAGIQLGIISNPMLSYLNNL